MRTRNCPAPAKFDVLAHNPINTSGGATRSAINPDDASSPDLDRIMRVLRAAERAGTVLPGRHPLWATESWWDSNPPNSAGAPLGLQARWTQQAMYLAWQDGASVFINLLIRDLGSVSNNRKDALDSGIFFANGQPKPAYTAFRFPSSPSGSTGGGCAPGARPGGRQAEDSAAAGKRWVTVKKLKVGQGAVFTAKLPLPREAAAAGEGRRQPKPGLETGLISPLCWSRPEKAERLRPRWLRSRRSTYRRGRA